MTEVKVSSRAFCKMIFHAAKYPHCAVNGVLLTKSRPTSNKEIELVDAVPLSHICINLTPMAEIALMQIDELASSRGLVIAGYYAANEHLRDNTFEKAHHKVAEKIVAHHSPSFIVVLNNTEFSSKPNISILKVAQLVDGGFKQFDEQNVGFNPAENTSEVAEILMKEKEFTKLVDFDNHLDDIRLDWMNVELNQIIEDSS